MSNKKDERKNAQSQAYELEYSARMAAVASPNSSPLLARDSQHHNQDYAYNTKIMTGHGNNVYSNNSLIHKSNCLLSKQLSIWGESSADIIITLVLADEAIKISKSPPAFRIVRTYGVEERLLKYCFLGSSNRFSTYIVLGQLRQ